MSYNPLKVVRRDGDAEVGVDGDTQSLYNNAIGRLKVSTQPGSIPLVTGSITAAQPVMNTPVAGGTIEADVRRASNLNVFCSGTFSGVNCTFEGSVEDSGNNNWFGIQAVRTNANTIETATGVLSAQPIYAWELSVNALSRFRIRATARTSGTQVWNILPGVYATEPIPAIQTHAITGTLTGITGGVKIASNTTTGGALSYTLVSTAGTNANLVGAASARTLYGIQAFNNGAAVAYVKIYANATAPTVGTTVPVMTMAIPAGSGFVWSAPPQGVAIAAGLGVAITGGNTAADTTAVTANQVNLNLQYN